VALGPRAHDEQVMSTDRARIDTALHRLHTVLVHHDLRVMSGAPAAYLADFEERVVGGIEHAVAAGESLVKPLPSKKTLTTAEAMGSLATTLIAIAQDRNGLRRPDALHALVVRHCPEADREYWAGESERRVFGLIRHEPDVRKLVADVIVEARDDNLVLLVNTRWLSAHADIRRHITDPWEGGRRCRFCLVTEPPQSLALQPVEPEKRSRLDLVNGVLQLQAATIYTHAVCEPFWRQWLAIAESYPSQEAAEEADKAAGREPRTKPAAPDEPAPETSQEGKHTNPYEQGFLAPPQQQEATSRLKDRIRKARGQA
jgi:hypothetical protein